RPLIHEEEKDPSELSRKDETFVSKSGLISIAGGKLTGYRKMAERVNETVIKQLKDRQTEKFDAPRTEHITLTSHHLRNNKEVFHYRKQLQLEFEELEIENAEYLSWYFTATYGKQTDIIKKKINFFVNPDVQERMMRAELWYSIHFEMTNSLSDFFVRRTGRLYFDVDSIQANRKLVLQDFIDYLDWDEERVVFENKKLDQLIFDATHFYKDELETK
ncbi:MAG: glycerol-3-phosphate dehydrogenase C-terminal domain-containing protein, partial [Leeuwenhoekiella sp.]